MSDFKELSPLQALSDKELIGLLTIAATIYQETPIEIDIKEGTINVADSHKGD